MGIILAPLILFWLFAIVFSLRMGYVFFSGESIFPYISLVFLFAIIVALLYVWLGLSSFADKKELWAFQIHFFFAANKYAITLFVLAVLAYKFGVKFYNKDYFKVLIFILSFSISLGSIVGVFFSDAFMEKNNIAKTY